METSIDKIINIQTFDSLPDLFDNNRLYSHGQNKYFNDRKYFHVIWNLLHLLSVEYPDIPTEQQKLSLVDFIKNFKKFSCGSCSKRKVSNENENEINIAILSKHNFIQFLIDYHKNTNASIRRFDVNNNNIDYTVDIIIQKYKDSDYKTYFKTIYDVDVEKLIIDANFNLLYDKLIHIKQIIRAQENIEIIFSHKLN
jgi:hypothetical protein